MIGSTAIAVLVGSACFAAAIGVALVRRMIKLRVTSFKGTAAAGVFFLVSGLITFTGLHQWRNLHKLQMLNAGSVIAVEVGGKPVSSRTDVDKIVSALQQSTWFLPSHGGYGKEVAIRLSKADGTSLSFTVADYSFRDGAVLSFSSDGTAEAFSPHLQDVLASAGSPLPPNALRRR